MVFASRGLAVAICVLVVATAPVLAAAAGGHGDRATTSPAVGSDAVASAVVDRPERPAALAVQETLPNTITIRSTGDERANYTITVSGRIEPGSDADTEDADVPDEASNTTATGSAAEGGQDSFRFAGNITSLSIRGGPVDVFVNGEQVDPGQFPTTPTPTPTSTTTATPTPTPTPTPTTTTTTATTTTTTTTATPTPTPTPTPATTTTTTTSATPTEASTATSATTPPSTTAQPTTQASTATAAATSTAAGSPGTITAGAETTTPAANGTTAAANDSGILGGLSVSTVAFVLGLLLVVLFGVAALVARRRDSRPETALDSDSK
jgi:hypothetical protein